MAAPRLKQPADLFQSLRSNALSTHERIHLAHTHWSNQDFKLPHKQLYFLRWILQPDLYQPKNQSDIKEKQAENKQKFSSPVQHPVFWELFSQLVSNINPQELSTVIGGPGSNLLLCHTLSNWSNLFEDLQLSENVLKSLQEILPILSQILSLDTCLSFLVLIFKGLLQLQHSISQPAERIVLLVINAILPTVELSSNWRKAVNSILLNPKVLSDILQILPSDYITSSVKSSLLLILKTLTLSVESLKKIHVNKNTKIEWLEALGTAGKSDNNLNSAAIQVVTHLTSSLIHDIPNLRSHLFNQHLSLNVPQSSNSRAATADLTHLHATRTLILHVFYHSFHVLKDLGESDASNLLDCMTAIKEVVGLVSKINLYNPADPIQQEILDEIASYCTSHLSHSSRDIVMNSLQTLVNFLRLDYTLIEARLSSILDSLVVPTYTSSHEVDGPMDDFFEGVFNWFSKAKQMPNLFTKWLEAIESKLKQNFTLAEIQDGPMMARKFLERSHEEIRLSISSAQVASIHDMLCSRFHTNLQNLVLFPTDSNPEPSSKRRKISSSSQTVSKSEDKSSGVNNCSANLCEIISSFYELFIVAASRSPIQSREWSRLSQKTSSFATEIIAAIISPTLKHWPVTKSSGKNRFRKWKQSQEQIILASAFRIIASVYQVQGLEAFTELKGLDLSEWLELLHQVSSTKKDQLNPKLTFELIHLCLEYTSQAISSLQSVDLTVSRAAYQTIFQLIEAYEGDLKNTTWNGSIISITSSQLVCTLWYHLTTAYLSDFATSALPEQWNQFTQLVIKHGSPPNASLLEKQNRSSFFELNRMMLKAPTFYECTNLREPFLKNIVAGFTSVMSLEEKKDGVVFDNSQLEMINGLFDLVSHIPLSYFTKWTRKQLLNWALSWNLILNGQKETAQLTLTEINCRKFLCRLVSDPLYSINPHVMQQAVTLTIHALNFGQRKNSQESLIQVTEKLNSGIVSKLMKNIKPGDQNSESNVKLLDTFCSAIAQRIGKVVETINQTKSIIPQDRLILSTLGSIIGVGKMLLNFGKSTSQLSTSRVEESQFFHQHFGKSIQPILDQFQISFIDFQSKGSLSFSSNLGIVKLAKLYLQLCCLDGNKLRSQTCPIDLESIMQPIDEINQSLITLSSHQLVQTNFIHIVKQKEEIISECLNLFEEIMEINRDRYSSCINNKPKDCTKAFQALVVAHVHLRTTLVTTRRFMLMKQSINNNNIHLDNMDDDDFMNFKLRRSFVNSCKNASLLESYHGLLLILNHIHTSYSDYLQNEPQNDSHYQQSKNDLFFRMWVLIDLGFLLILNFPTHRKDSDIPEPNVDYKGFEEEMVLKLLKSFKLLNHLDDSTTTDDNDNQFKSLVRKTLYAWKIELIDQLCVQKVNNVDGRSVLEILEQMMEISSDDQIIETNAGLYEGIITIIKDMNQESLRRIMINNVHLIVKILTNLIHPSKNLKNYARLMSDLTSTNAIKPAISKHAPFLIISIIIKICSSSSFTYSEDNINSFIKNGLFSLISSIGKFERIFIGQYLLDLSSSSLLSLDLFESSHLFVYWKKVLKDWEDFRYKGKD